MAALYFFLSYARDDRTNDEHDAIGRFHAAVVKEIKGRTGVQDAIGFFDTRDIAPGETWPDELRDALRTCRAFVPILSPTYFSREYCGKEWAVFRARLDTYARAGGRRPPLIQPVLLFRREDLAPLPEAITEEAGDLQTNYERYPEIYGAEGLHFMTRLGQHKDDLNLFCIRFAQRLIEAVEAAPIPLADDVPPIKDVQSAFHVAGTQLTATAPAPPSIGKFAQFAFIAGRRTELEALRKDVSAYGDEGGLDWQPFRPGVEDEVSILAQEVTSQEKLRYEAVPADEHFAARLDQAKDERKIVVVIVDPWTLGLDAYRQLMKELDQRVLPNCVVVVPWNVSDSETVASRTHLQNVIRLSFENKAALEDPNLLLEGISSCKELKDEISKFFAQARLRLISIENVRQSASEGRLIAKPVVTGPGG